MLQLCPISLMQLPALPHHMVPSLLLSNRSLFHDLVCFQLLLLTRIPSQYHSLCPFRGQAHLLALPSMCGLWIPDSAAWHTPGCMLEPVRMSREKTTCTFCMFGPGMQVAQQELLFKPHKPLPCRLSHLRQAKPWDFTSSVQSLLTISF